MPNNDDVVPNNISEQNSNAETQSSSDITTQHPNIVSQLMAEIEPADRVQSSVDMRLSSWVYNGSARRLPRRRQAAILISQYLRRYGQEHETDSAQHFSFEARRLNLSFMELDSLPSIDFNLPELRVLILKNNRFTSIPEQLASLPNNCRVYLSGNDIHPASWALFQARPDYQDLIERGLRFYFSAEIYNPNSLTGSPFISDEDGNRADEILRARRLSVVINEWHLTMPELNLIAAWNDFDNGNHANSISAFFDKLALTVNFKSASFRSKAANLLKVLAGDLELYNQIVALAIDGLGACTDRIALTFEKMQDAQLILEIRRGAYDDRPIELFELLRQQFRKQKLQDFVRQMDLANRLSDPVETELALITRLRSSLRLGTVGQSMQFGSIANTNLTEADIRSIEISIKAAEYGFSSYLVDSDLFKEILQRWNPEKFSQAMDLAIDSLEGPAYERKILSYLRVNDLDNTEINRIQAAREVAKKIQTQHLLTLGYNLLLQRNLVYLIESPWGLDIRVEPWERPTMRINAFVQNHESSRNTQQFILQLNGDHASLRACQYLMAKNRDITTWGQLECGQIGNLVRWNKIEANLENISIANISQGNNAIGQAVRITLVGHPYNTGIQTFFGSYTEKQLKASLMPLLAALPKELNKLTINLVGCELGGMPQTVLADSFPAKLATALEPALIAAGVPLEKVFIHFRFSEVIVVSSGRKKIFKDGLWVSANNSNQNTPGSPISKGILTWINEPEIGQAKLTLQNISEETFSELQQTSFPSRNNNALSASNNRQTPAFNEINSQIFQLKQAYNSAVSQITNGLLENSVATSNIRRINGTLEAEFIEPTGVISWKAIDAKHEPIFIEFKQAITSKINLLNEEIPVSQNLQSSQNFGRRSHFFRAIGITSTWFGGFFNIASLLHLIEGNDYASKTAQIQMIAALSQGSLNGVDDILRLTAWSSMVTANALSRHGNNFLPLINRLSNNINRLNPASQGFIKIVLNANQNTLNSLATRLNNLSTMMSPMVMGANLSFAALDFGISASDVATATYGLPRDLAVMRLGMSGFNLLMTAAIISTTALGFATAAAALNIFSLLLLPVMIALPFYMHNVLVNGYKYESAVSQMDELLFATQNPGLQIKDGIYYIHHALPVMEINFLTGKINYGDVYIGGLEGGTAHTSPGGFHSYAQAPSVVWDETRRLNIWPAYNFQNEQSFNLPLATTPILLPCTPSYDLKASYGQTTSTRYRQQDSLQRIASYYDGARHDLETQNREFFLYQYYAAGGFSDTGIVSLERFNKNSRLKVILDDNDRHLIVPQILDYRTRMANPRYEIFGAGGRYTIAVCQGYEIIINNSGHLNEQWHLQIDQLTHTTFDYEREILALQESINQLTNNIASTTNYIYSSMTPDNGSDNQRRINSEYRHQKSIKEQELNRLKSLHGRQNNPVENFFQRIQFNRGYLNIGAESIKLNGNWEQPIILSLNITNGVSLQIIFNRATGERQVQVLSQEINGEILKQIHSYLTANADRQTIAPNGFISLIFYKDEYSKSGTGFMEFTNNPNLIKAEILEYSPIGIYKNYKIMGFNSNESPHLVTHFSGMQKLQIVPAENGKHCYEGQFKAGMQKLNLLFRSTNMPVGGIFTGQLDLEMLMYKPYPEYGNAAFDAIWRNYKNENNPHEIYGMLSRGLADNGGNVANGKIMNVSLAAGCIISGTTLDGKNIVLEKNINSGKIDLLSANWQEIGSSHQYIKNENGTWEHHIEILNIAPNGMPSDQFTLLGNCLEFLGRYRQVESTFIVLPSTLLLLRLDPNMIAGAVNIVGGAKNLRIIPTEGWESAYNHNNTNSNSNNFDDVLIDLNDFRSDEEFELNQNLTKENTDTNVRACTNELLAQAMCALEIEPIASNLVSSTVIPLTSLSNTRSQTLSQTL